MNFFNSFAEKHPKAAEWFRKGGLFLIFSWAVTAIKAVMLMFLPNLFHGMVGDVEWLFPGIPVELFGVGFKLSIIGNALEVGPDGAFLVNSGLAFTLANLTAIFFGEVINFPLQRNVTFKSHGPLPPQIGLHLLATIGVFLVMNLFTCVWNPICLALLPEAVRNLFQSIVTTVVTGGVAMVIIFAVDNKIFAPGFGEKK